MFFSGKLTNSFLNGLDREGQDLQGIFETTNLPAEFLRDPTCWLDAADIENFLSQMQHRYGSIVPKEERSLASFLGHQCAELRSWGVLDSVLRMMQKPEDIFHQPQRFLSYFISPAPPIGNLKSASQEVSFELPISDNEFPHVVDYLSAAIESLPEYVGKARSHVNWVQSKVTINWSSNQKTFLEPQDLSQNIKPELIQSMLISLENSQQDIQSKNAELAARNQEIEALKKQVTALLNQTVSKPLWDNRVQEVFSDVRGEFLKFNDYFARAQQLITLLIGQGRMDRQVREAMKRVGWEHVQTAAPQTLNEVLDGLENLEAGLKGKNQEKPKSVVTKKEDVSNITQLNFGEINHVNN